MKQEDVRAIADDVNAGRERVTVTYDGGWPAWRWTIIGAFAGRGVWIGYAFTRWGAHRAARKQLRQLRRHRWGAEGGE